MFERLTIEYVKEQTSVIAPGYILLSTKYVSAHEKLEFMCPKGHIFWMCWNSFQRGYRCPKCYRLSLCLDINYVKEQTPILAPGYKLLSTEYKNANEKMEFICDKGHEFWMCWGNFQQGIRCAECFYESRWKDYTPEELTKLNNYQSAARSLTEQIYKIYYEIINPNNKERSNTKYHLDHIFPIIEGFRCDIPIKYIANPYNLQMLSARKNRIKHDDPWQTEKALYRGYARFENKLLKEA